MNKKRYLVRNLIIEHNDGACDKHCLVYLTLTLTDNGKLTAYEIQSYDNNTGELPGTEYLDTFILKVD